MPDISRSDSNRSDASRPRVSFNRDVHVKRINGPRTANAYSLSSDGTTFVPTSIRRERPMTKKEMTKEAEVVLKQVDKLSCTATSNIKLETDKPKTKKKRKNSFSFLKKLDKTEKTKNSSSDVDSGSSQELRIYRVNSPIQNINNNKIKQENDAFRNTNKKIYDFMSLDRKKLKRETKNQNLDYLSLERHNDVLEKMKKERPNKTNIMQTMFDKTDGKSKKTATPSPPLLAAELKEATKPKPKIVLDIADDKMAKKKQLSPIIESPGVSYFEKKKENNVEKMIKKLTEKQIPKLSKNTGMTGVKEPQSDNCHNDNKPFSYTSRNKSDTSMKLGGTINTEGLGDGKEELKSTSPTSDVIYAQVIVGGRDGNVQKPTVNERVASNEVGRVFVGENSNQSQVGLNYKIESNRNDGVCERVTVESDEMWQGKNNYLGRKEREENFRTPTMELYGENPGRRDLFRRKSNESSDHTSPSPSREEYTRVIKVAPKYETGRIRDKSPTDLHDLSIRREILLSRSESQAKERFNSLKRLQEPTRVKRSVTNVNGIRPGESLTNDVRYLGDDIKINEKFSTNLRKIPKDVELVEPMVTKKRESKLDAYLKEKEEKFKNDEKNHVIKTEDDDNLLIKLKRIGKSKSFIQEKPKNKRMEKMKMLFKKKKEGRSSESDDDPLASRYVEYRGSDIEMSDRSTDSSPRRNIFRTEASQLENSLSGRKRLPTPTTYDSMGTLTRIKNDKNKDSHWFKSLDKTGKKGKQKIKMDDNSSEITNSLKPPNLRFFGDTDQESTTNETDFPEFKLKQGLYRHGKISDSDEDPLIIPGRSESRMTESTLKGSSSGKYKSKYDLDRPDYGLKQMNHGLHLSSNKNEYPSSNLSDSSTLKNDNFDLNGLKYGPKVTRSLSSVTNSTTKYGEKEKLRNLRSTPTITLTTPEEPLSRRVKSYGNLYSQEDKRGNVRRRLYDSSAESATEGDSSQHSSKSMIYLHAATVGDIPGPRNIYKSDKRSQSREELSSVGESTILVPGKKTLSRSISVLAPWRPRHNKEDRTLHYDSAVDFNKGKPPTGIGKNKRSSSRDRKSNELRFNTIGKENRRRKDLIR